MLMYMTPACRLVSSTHEACAEIKSLSPRQLRPAGQLQMHETGLKAHIAAWCATRLHTAEMSPCRLAARHQSYKGATHPPLLQVEQFSGPPLESAAEPSLEATGRGTSWRGPAGVAFQLSPGVPVLSL